MLRRLPARGSAKLSDKGKLCGRVEVCRVSRAVARRPPKTAKNLLRGFLVCSSNKNSQKYTKSSQHGSKKYPRNHQKCILFATLPFYVDLKLNLVHFWFILVHCFLNRFILVHFWFILVHFFLDTKKTQIRLNLSNFNTMFLCQNMIFEIRL